MAKFKLPPGFINVNKDAGMTAHDVVASLRRLTGIKQIGHAGTLDPQARGVLPMAIGRACRLLRFLPDDKVYLASILFGKRTDTDDVEGKVIAESSYIPTVDEIAHALKSFVGYVKQTPPLYSAIHINGRRLYELARKGETPVEIPSRNVHIYSIELLDYNLETPNHTLNSAIGQPEQNGRIFPNSASSCLNLRIHCSSGTYIRSIARDLGEVLGSAACLSGLLRERAGLFEIQESHSLAELAESAERGTLSSLLESPEARLPQASVELSKELCTLLTYGQRISIKQDVISRLGEVSGAIQTKLERSPPFVLALLDGKLIAVCSLIMQKNQGENEYPEAKESSIVELKPEVVLTDEISF